MNRKELIERIKNLPFSYIHNEPYLNKEVVLEFVKHLDEPEIVKIPQFVANWIANVKRNGFKFRNSSRFYEEIVSSDDVYRVMYYILKESIAGEAIRIWVNANRDAFARAWLDGYEVEKEKRYRVKMKGMSEENTYLTFRFGHTWMLSNFEECEEFRLHHTRKEIEDAGFGEVFNSPLFEVEEVEE